MSAAQKKRRIEVGDWVRIIAVSKDSFWSRDQIKRLNAVGPQHVIDIVYYEEDRRMGMASFVDLEPGMSEVCPLHLNKVRLQRVPAPVDAEQPREASDD